jgi:hypothetical protein
VTGRVLKVAAREENERILGDFRFRLKQFGDCLNGSFCIGFRTGSFRRSIFCLTSGGQAEYGEKCG